LTIRPHPQQNT